MQQSIVITSINGVTESVEGFLDISGWQTVLVGDKKTPAIDDSAHDQLTYISPERQSELGFELTELLPFNHYSRKNLGYLYAISHGTEQIADTDDDNTPKDGWDEWLSTSTAVDAVTAPQFPNVYRLFSDQHVWPRGYPLSRVRRAESISIEQDAMATDQIAIVQGLADVEPDVDAIYRLVIGDTVEFADRDPVALDAGVYSPFNSQNSLWFPPAFVYLYLPSTVTFRFTDILRGYIAQRGLWALGRRLGFIGASVVQDRNPHDLMQDFESEIPCYTRITETVRLLDDLTLAGDPVTDIETMYATLEDAGIVTTDELRRLDAWTTDIVGALA